MERYSFAPLCTPTKDDDTLIREIRGNDAAVLFGSLFGLSILSPYLAPSASPCADTRVAYRENLSSGEIMSILDAELSAEEPNSVRIVEACRNSQRLFLVRARPYLRQLVDQCSKADPWADLTWELMLALWHLDESVDYFLDLLLNYRENDRLAGNAVMLLASRDAVPAIIYEQIPIEGGSPFLTDAMVAVEYFRDLRKQYGESESTPVRLRLLLVGASGGWCELNGEGSQYSRLEGASPFALWSREELERVAVHDAEGIAATYRDFSVENRTLGDPYPTSDDPEVKAVRAEASKLLRAYLYQFLPERVRALVHKE